MITNEPPINLDDFLASRFFDVSAEKLNVYEAILAALLRKYVPVGEKIKINLLKQYKDTILDITLDTEAVAKISWKDG